LNHNPPAGLTQLELEKLMTLKIIIPMLLAATWLGNMALAATPVGSCPGSSMSATQYGSGRHTASGQPFRPDGLTAAHRSLRFGTRLKVTNPRTGASAVVVINDRGPFTRGRDIDLSEGAARAIGLSSVGRVCTEPL
jgi:rare lipoprotein A